MNWKDEFMNAYNESLYNKIEKRIPSGPVNMETIYEEIERLKPRLDKMDKLITMKERAKYWRNNIYKFNKTELSFLPLELKNRYVEHYARVLSYTILPKSLIVATFLFVLFISLIYYL
jgi:hypothetical protein